MLVGAGGSIGATVLKSLLAEPQLETTILARASSKSNFLQVSESSKWTTRTL